MVFAGKYFTLHPHKNSWRAENSVCTTVMFDSIPKYNTRKRLLNFWSLGMALYMAGQAVQCGCGAMQIFTYVCFSFADALTFFNFF